MTLNVLKEGMDFEIRGNTPSMGVFLNVLKEGMDFEMDNVIEDNNASYFCRNDFISYFTGHSDKPTQDEIEAIDDGLHQNYLFFRFVDAFGIQDINSLLDRINKYSMWLPQFIWLHGHFYDQYEGLDMHTPINDEGIKWYQVQAEVDETKGKVGWDLHYQIEHSEVYLSPHVRLTGNKAAMIGTQELAQSYANRCAPIFKKRGHVVFFDVVEWGAPASPDSKRGLSLLATIQEHSQIIQARLDQDVMAPNKKPLM